MYDDDTDRYDFDAYEPKPTRTRAQRAAAIRNREGLPRDECVTEAGYDARDCNCPLCDQ